MVKTKTRVNAADIFLILLVIGILAAMFMRSAYVINLIFGDTYNVTYSVELKAVDEELIETIKEGDKLYLNKDNVSLGKMISLKSEVAEGKITTASGSEVVGKIEGKLDIILTVNADILKNNTSYVIGSDIVFVEGAEMYVNIGEIYAKATIIDIQFGEMTKK